MSVLNIMCWNVRGIMSSAYVLSELLEKHDIDVCIVSEHKLLIHSRSFMDSIHPAYKSISVCDTTIYQYGPAKCGKGGVSILYKKSLSNFISEVDCVNNIKVLCLEMKSEPMESVFIIGVYMPAESYVDSYIDAISELEAVTKTCIERGKVIVLGDFNSQLPHTNEGHDYRNNEKTAVLQHYLANNDLITLHDSKCSYSYVRNRTKIDHILIENYLTYAVKSFNVITDIEILTSDHLPLILSLWVKGKRQLVQEPSNRVAWDKCTDHDISYYQHKLSNLLPKPANYTTPPGSISDFIVHAVLKASSECLPKVKYNRHSKPYWSQEIKQAHAESRRLRRIWINLGRLRGNEHESYRNYKAAKRYFRCKQRLAFNQYVNHMFDELNKTAQSNLNQFWKLVKRRKKTGCNVCPTIVYRNISYYDENIPQGFSRYFEDIYFNTQREQIRLGTNLT